MSASTSEHHAARRKTVLSSARLTGPLDVMITSLLSGALTARTSTSGTLSLSSVEGARSSWFASALEMEEVSS